MGGIVGRLFREFAITLSVADSRLGGGLADAHADDVRAAAAAQHAMRSTGASIRLTERVFEAVLDCYGRRLQLGAAAPVASRSLVAVATLVATVLLYVIVPKGFFPQQDTGVILGVTEARADHLVHGHGGAPAGSWPSVMLQDPDVESLSLVHRCWTVERHAQQRPHLHQAQAARPAQARAPARSSTPAARHSLRSTASRCSCRPCRTCRSKTGSAAPSTNTRLQDRRPRELARMGAASCSRSCDALPELRDVASDQQNQRPAGSAWSSIATPPRGWASRRRRSTTRSTTRSASGRSRPSSPS